MAKTSNAWRLWRPDACSMHTNQNRVSLKRDTRRRIRPNAVRLCVVKRGLFTCVHAFGSRVALSVALAAAHLHELSVERVEDVAVHRVHGVGQLLPRFKR